MEAPASAEEGNHQGRGELRDQPPPGARVVTGRRGLFGSETDHRPVGGGGGVRPGRKCAVLAAGAEAPRDVGKVSVTYLAVRACYM
jgi:hypothetical protein